MDMKSIPQVIIDLVKSVFDGDISIVDWDLDRIYLECHNEEFIIRTWNVTESVVDWTLFRMTETHGIEIKSGCFHYKKL